AAVLGHEKVEGPPVSGDRFERSRVALPLEELLRRPAVESVRLTAVASYRLYQHQAIRILVRRRREQNALDQAEDRGGGADSERQREDGNRREPGLSGEQPQTEPHVFQHGCPQSPRRRRTNIASVRRVPPRSG